MAEAIKHEADVYAREKRQLVDTFWGRECTQEVDVHVEKKNPVGGDVLGKNASTRLMCM